MVAGFDCTRSRIVRHVCILLACLVVCSPSVAQSDPLPLTTQLGGGRDLAVPCAGMLVFGDTFAPDWQPNTAADRNGGRLSIINGGLALWQPDADAVASVPTDCVGSTLAYMDATGLSGHDFQITSSGVIDVNTWTKYRLFEGDTRFGNVAFAGDGWLLASEGGRTGAAYLARSGNLYDAAAYEWWNGAGWSGMDTAAPVVSDTVGEMDICTRGGRYIVAYLSPAYNAIVTRVSSDLVNWSEARVLWSWDTPGMHGTYSPRFLDGCEGGTVTVTISHFEPLANGYPAYNVYSHAMSGALLD